MTSRRFTPDGPSLLVGKLVKVRVQGVVPDRYFILPQTALRPGDEVVMTP